MKLLIAVDLLVLLIAVGVFFAIRSSGETAENVANAGLRGSLPPAGQSWPALDAISGIEPAVPTVAEITGSPAMLVATCVDCRSGDVLGGYLGRLADGDVPEGVAAHVVTWGGDVAAWTKRSAIDRDRFVIHDASDPAATAQVRRLLGIAPRSGQEESGAVMLFDAAGTWRSTYALGQLDRDDIRHDLEQLRRDRD